MYESNLGFREPSIEIKKSVKLLSKNPRNGFSDTYTSGYLTEQALMTKYINDDDNT